MLTTLKEKYNYYKLMKIINFLQNIHSQRTSIPRFIDKVYKPC